MLVNGNEVIDRYNRPGTNQPVALRIFFINDGILADPLDISGVSIFNLANNQSPSSILNDLDVVASGASSTVLMNFGNANTRTSSSDFDVSNYTPGTQASGIFKINTGEYVVVLDGSRDLSGMWNLWGNNTNAVKNGATAAIKYIDVWTVKQVANADVRSIIQNFQLYDNTFTTVTQPLLLTAVSKLVTKRIHLGSKIDLKISNEVTIGNRDIDESIQNIFRDSVITSASVEILKINDESSLPATVTVSSWGDTSALVDVTSDNTMVLNWNTDTIKNLASVAAGTHGSITGRYTVQARFNIMNQLLYSDKFNLVID